MQEKYRDLLQYMIRTQSGLEGLGFFEKPMLEIRSQGCSELTGQSGKHFRLEEQQVQRVCSEGR